MLNKNAKFFKNYPNVSAVKSVAEKLPIESNSLDIYLISFGLRNLTNIESFIIRSLQSFKKRWPILLYGILQSKKANC